MGRVLGVGIAASFTEMPMDPPYTPPLPGPDLPIDPPIGPVSDPPVLPPDDPGNPSPIPSPITL
jgi:hypothetical protein